MHIIGKCSFLNSLNSIWCKRGLTMCSTLWTICSHHNHMFALHRNRKRQEGQNNYKCITVLKASEVRKTQYIGRKIISVLRKKVSLSQLRGSELTNNRFHICQVTLAKTLKTNYVESKPPRSYFWKLHLIFNTKTKNVLSVSPSLSTLYFVINPQAK